ncbi:MAG: alpha-L-fucosidase [Prevotella sp.]|nr:alpha-L-fucosidase [Prevotella sp.]
MRNRRLLLFLSMLFAVLSSAWPQELTRGIGTYPGRLGEYYGPVFSVDTAYTNIALHRIVTQSSAYDYNLTAQLLTDGVADRQAPVRLEARANGRLLGNRERESALDGNEWTRVLAEGSNVTLDFCWHNMLIKADEVVLHGYVAYAEGAPSQGSRFVCTAVDDKGKALQRVLKSKTLPGKAMSGGVSSDPNKQTETGRLPARELNEGFKLRRGMSLSRLEFSLQLAGAAYWVVTEIEFVRDGKTVHDVLPSGVFRSWWMPAPDDVAPWVCVDLGTVADISEVRLHGEDEHAARLSVSADGKTWKHVSAKMAERARYVRVETAGMLSEIEVFGRNGLRVLPHPEVGWQGDKYMLNGGDWRLSPADSPALAVTATVPATVLSSYVNAGSLPDTNFDDNVAMVSESFFLRNFLYTRTFRVPKEMLGKRILLNFDGINWQASVQVNGHDVGTIMGAFLRKQFDITPYVSDESNTLKVRIIANANPGAVKTKNEQTTDFNGGILGADNPTYHATVGWDWITTVRGRDIGIWNDVYLSSAETITISDPLVSSEIDGNRATMTPSVFLKNHLGQAVSGTLKGFIGEIRFEKSVTIPALSEQEVTFLPGEYPQLLGQEMHLWWPNGYGEPYLYEAGYSFIPSSSAGEPQASISYKAGIREVTWRDELTRLQLFVNGKRLVPLGGNWGFPESNLNYRGREYDTAVGYHRQMNLNMIRNWVGQTGDDEFFEACDRNGIMVWQDFWLANPVDGPNPDNEQMFVDNAQDFVRRIRQHPSIALYCGRNEGYPPGTLNRSLASIVETNHPHMLYIPSSADDGVSGHGPYQARPVEEYFERQTGKLHTERGMPNMPNIESLRRMLSEEHLWPQGEHWGRHDFTQQGAQAGASFNAIIDRRFGYKARITADDSAASLYASLAQWQNYDGYRAMYEASNSPGTTDIPGRQGLLIWMSHACWPSMVWQTYDYYFEPTAAFFGVKKACEPLHVQYNASSNSVELVNLAVEKTTVRVEASVLDMWGKTLWQHQMSCESAPDTSQECFKVSVPNGYEGVFFLRLKGITDRQLATETNTYVLSTNGTQEALWQLPKANISLLSANMVEPNQFVVTNNDTVPALMIRLNLKGTDGEQILPVDYSDNYFHLMPGESKTVTIDWKAEDARKSEAVVEVSGFNVDEFDALLPLPSSAQVAWQDMETYAFIHFTTNTFNDMEWGYGNASPRIFNPRRLNTGQWVKVLGEAGMQGVILTAKHHDGFCLWPTQHTDYNISASPYKNGRGDVVGELAEACKQRGLKMGLYLSPWDRHQSIYGTKAYVDYYHRQLDELLTCYGPLFEVWLDGANGGDGWYGGARETRQIDHRSYYDYPRIHEIIRSHNPDAIVFSDAGPGCRWVGNERGEAGETNWSFLRHGQVYPGYPHAEELTEGHPDGNQWVASECDVSIRPGWFYHRSEDSQVKSPETLFDLYCKSVGRNGTFLLNVPVNRDGLIAEQDVKSLQGYKKLLDERLGHPLATWQQNPSSTTDADGYTVLRLALEAPAKVAFVVLAEDITRGQRVRSFSVDYLNADGQWRRIPTNDAKTTIGHKRILRLHEPVETTALRLTVTDARLTPVIKTFEAY